MEAKRILNYAFHLICILGTFFFVADSLYLYLLDEDTTQVEYYQFHSHNGSIYPSISFCLRFPITLKDDPWIQFINSTNNRTRKPKTIVVRNFRRQYRKFMEGQLFSKVFVSADYDDLTVDLYKYVKSYVLYLNGGKKVKWRYQNGTFQITHAYTFREVHGGNDSKVNLTDDFIAKIQRLNTYVSFRRYTQKCFTFDTPWIPGEKVEMIDLKISPQVFQQKAGTIPLSSRKFSIHYHFPYQKMTSLTKPNGWLSEITTKTKDYVRKHYIGNIEVLRRRNKDGNPCIGGNYDDQVTLMAAQDVGCKHPVSKISYQNCNNTEGIEKFNHELYDVDPTIKYLPPCRSLISLSESQGEDSKQCKSFCQFNDEKNKKKKEENMARCMSRCEKSQGLGIQIIFNDYIFREVIYSKVISVESMLGNMGGYIGKNIQIIDNNVEDI